MLRCYSILHLLLALVLNVSSAASSFDPEGSLYDDEDLLRLSLSGHRPSSLLNFNRYEVGMATCFADLAYKPENPNPKYAEDYLEEMQAHGLEGYRFSTFEGETGHTAITNYFAYKSVLGFIAESDHSVYVAFRGSITKADFTTDLYVWNPTFTKAQFNGNETGKVHVGFCKTFDSCKKGLKKKILQSVETGKRSLIISGHSMGGALANLAALYFAQVFELNKIQGVDIKLVTFNAPRVGSINFAKRLEAYLGLHNMIRFTVGTREGAATLMLGSFGFKHAGTNVVVPQVTQSKLQGHKMCHFLDGAAVNAFMLFNMEPKKAYGVKSHLSSYQLIVRDKISKNTTAFLSSIWLYVPDIKKYTRY